MAKIVYPRFPRIPDNQPPTVKSRAIKVTNITSTGFTISWEMAQDNVTAVNNILYQVALKESKNPQDPWRIVKAARGISSHSFQGLKPNKTYAFYVEAMDAKGNVLHYPVDNGCMTATTASKPTGGGSGGTGSTSDEQRRQQIRDYFKTQKGYDTIADVMVSTMPPKKDYIISGRQAMKLINEEYNIYNQRDDFMPINEAGIYPGRLVYADKNLVNGKPSDINFYVANQTGKVTVTVNFLASNVSLSEKGVTASYSDVQNAISRILTRALASGALPPTRVESTTTTSNSKEKIAIDAGCSVDYMGAKCNIDTTTTKNQESFYQMESFKQGFYQVSVEAEDRDSVNYLGTGVTLEAVKNARSHGPLAIIKSVTYGRVGYNIKKYDASSFTFKGSESGSYQTYVEVSSKQDIEKNSSSSTHFARIWGGNATTAGKALLAGRSTKNNQSESEKIDKDFTTEMTGNMEVNMKNQGVPISFTVEYLASGREVGAYLTGKYLESKYVPLVNRLSFTIEQNASVLKGTNSVELTMNYSYIKLDSNGNKMGEGTGKWESQWSNNSRKTDVIQLPERCYFKNNELLLTLKSRRAASAGLNKWKLGSSGYINVTGGKLKISIEGSYYSYSLHLGKDAKDGYAQFM